MNTVGPFNPTVAIDAGGGAGAWTNPNNVFVSDSVYASGDISGAGSSTNDLIAKGFNFAIPPVATILGIMVEVQRYGTNASDKDVYLTKLGAVVGTNKASTIWPTSAAGYQTYGDASDLWGTTWTPTDVNNAGFGVAVAAQNTHAGGTAFIDHIRITVYYTVGPLDVNINSPKTYTYKVYNNGSYLGNLPKVTSLFKDVYEINNPGSQIEVICGVSADISYLPGTEPIEDETGDPITDENDNNITTEGAVNYVSTGTNSNAIIRNGNQVIVWEYSYYHPLGIPVFRGKIERWEANYGGAGEDEEIAIMIYSEGTDLDNHLVRGTPFSTTIDQSSPFWNHSDGMYYSTADKGGGWNFDGQTFTVGAGVTNLAAIIIFIGGTADVTVSVYASPGSTTVLGSTKRYISTTPVAVKFTFPVPIPVTAAVQYFFTVTVDNGQSMDIYYQDTNPYGGGQMYNNNFAGGSGGGSWVAQTGKDLYFQTFSGNGATVATYTSVDPTIGMLEPIIDIYNGEGGLIQRTVTSIDATGLSLSYKFNVNTIAEGLKSILDISPNGFYWYVDLGSSILYFKQASVTPDIVLSKGVHLEKIKIVATIEHLVNSVYFTGGLVSGSNVYKSYVDSTSISRYGVHLDRPNNNLVTATTVADAIGQSEISEKKNEIYATVVSIMDKTMDISMLRPGMIVGFNGFGSFADTLLSQIVRIEYTPDQATITLGILPRRNDNRLEQVIRTIIGLSTIDNPTSPS